MEISCFPSSALRFSDLRCQQIVASPRLPAKLLGRASSKYSQISPSRLSISGRKGCSVPLSNSKHVLKPALLQAQTQQTEAISTFGGGAKPEHPIKSEAILRFLRAPPVVFAVLQFSSILARLVMVETPHVWQWTNWSMFIKILAAFTSISCSNIYGAAINQIFDIETDKINKPYLPLCTGEISIESAWLMVTGLVATSLLMAGTLNSLPFLAFSFCLLLLASLYSIPPFRTKASTFGAPITLSMGIGAIQVCTMLAGAQAVLGVPFRMSSTSIFISIYSSIFCLSMGIVKDIPDVEGDKKNNIPTVATIIGERRTLLIGLGILIVNHLGAALLSFTKPKVFKSSIMLPYHILTILFSLYEGWKLDKANYEATQSMKSYASFLGVYFVQILLFPFI